MIRPFHRAAWIAVNLAVLPVWVAMIVAPRSNLTRRLVERITGLYTALGITYGAFLAMGFATAEQRVNFLDIESVRTAFQNPPSLLAGWVHYGAFDLFVGRWIWEQSLEDGRPARISLLLCMLAGPLGLTTFLARRRLFA